MKLQTQFNILVLLFIFLNLNLTFAQEREVLPKGFSDKEKAELLVKGFQFKSSATAVAPTGAVRTAAEWEEVEYLVLSWNNSYNDILSEIVKASIVECKVIIAYYGVTENTIRTKLRSSPYSMTTTEIDNNVIFLSAPTDSIWIRDFAGNTVYSNDVGQLGLTDWRYNRNRNNDDQVPSEHASELGMSSY
ncbi:agmatine deiminase family protein, partial [Lutibacter sp.]|uniref:agmatine deiminase family protein n=1 Tax=Lutibacter sp. TaxID=1925666 RepID=UPI0034A01BB3